MNNSRNTQNLTEKQYLSKQCIIHMQNSTRQALELGIIGFLDAPPGVHLTLDLNSILTGEKFKGIKMVPEGLHLLTWSSSEYAPRVAKFLEVTRHDPLLTLSDPKFMNSQFVFRWSTEEETFYQCDLQTDAIAANFVSAARALYLDKELGAFPIDLRHRWLALTSTITLENLVHILPDDGYIRADADESFESRLVAAMQKEGEVGQMNKTFSVANPQNCSQGPAKRSILRYSFLPGVSSMSTPQSRTQYAMDTSATLLHLLFDRQRNIVHNDEASSATECLSSLEACANDLPHFRLHQANLSTSFQCVLCEYQTAFVLFLLCQSYASFERWKHFTDIFLRIDSLLLGSSQFLMDATNKEMSNFHSFLTSAYGIIYSHLVEIPEDLFIPDSAQVLDLSNHHSSSCTDNIQDQESSSTPKSSLSKDHIRKYMRTDASNFLFRSLNSLFQTIRDLLRGSAYSWTRSASPQTCLVLHVHRNSIFLNAPFVHVLKRILEICLEKFLWVPKVALFSGIHGLEYTASQSHLENIQLLLNAKFQAHDPERCIHHESDKSASQVHQDQVEHRGEIVIASNTVPSPFPDSASKDRLYTEVNEIDHCRQFSSMEELLASLRMDGDDDDDMPAVVFDDIV